jgi:hypothetical protein
VISIATAFRVMVGLFVDDGALALALLTVVLLSWILVTLWPGMPLAAGASLLVGSVGVLVVNVVQAARHR